jgi:RNA polymerase sigma factor (sigma-70 family)
MNVISSNIKFPKITREVEAEYVAKAKAGDDEAWVFLYDRHSGFIVHRTRRYAGRFALLNFAEDLESEGRRAFAMSIRQFDPERKTRLVTLLGLLVRRLVLDFLARETRMHFDGTPPVSFDDHDPEDEREIVMVPRIYDTSLPENPEFSDNRRRLYEVLQILSPHACLVLTLRYVHLWRIEDLQSKAYGRPVPRERVHRDIERALLQLRELM